MADFTKFFVDSKTGEIKSIAASKINVLDLRAGVLRVGAKDMPGSDTNMFVSGAVDAKKNSAFGVSTFGGDVVVSGSTISEMGFSGSLTRLTDGTTYLAAGANITITSGSNGQVVIAGSDTGATTIVKEVLSFDTDGTSKNFGISGTPSDIAAISVYVNGILRLSGSANDYQYAQASNAISFIGPPPSGSIVQVVYTSDGSGGGGGGSGNWTQAGTNLYPNNLASDVGIGTSTPIARLEVGDGFGGSNALENISITNNSAADSALDLIEEHGGASSGFGTANAYGFRIMYDGGDNKLFVKTANDGTVNNRIAVARDTGRVGIGTDSPSTKVEIKTSNSDNVGALKIDADETFAIALEVDSESTFWPAIYSRGIAAAFLEQDISSGYGLFVTRDIAEAGAQPLATFDDDNVNNTQTTLKVKQDGTGDLVNFLTGSTEVMTVNSLGQMGVGTASPNEKITVEGAISLDELAYTPAATSGYGKIYVKSSDSKLYYRNDSGTEFDLTAAHSGGAPVDAQYLVLSANGTLSNERVITAGNGISLTDAGAGSTLTISASINSDDFAFSGGHLNLEDTVVKSAGTDSGTATPSGHSLTFTGGEAIDISASGATVTVAAEIASTTNLGAASFNSADFSLSSGHVSLDDNLLKQIGADTGTATAASHKIDIVGGPNVSVTATGDTVTVSSTAGVAEFKKEMLTREAPAGVTDYALQNTPSDGTQIQVYVNGLLMVSGSGYDYVYDSSNNKVDFSAAPQSGSIIQVVYTVEGSAEGTISGGFFRSTTAGSIFTTGATAFVGPQSSPAAPDAPTDIGTDVFFFVSGTIGSRGTSSTGSAVFGGDVVISGSLFGGSPLIVGDSLRVTGSVDASLGLSGSLTKLSNGSSYLVGGSNVTITSASNGQVTISSAGGGGSITVKENDGSPSVSDVTTISFDNAIVTDVGSNTVVISGTIGTAEDGSYEDGLFTSFNEKTYTGVAIDKINEALKELAPSPAPDLDDIDSSNTGAEVFLSFGSSNSITGYTNVGSSAGIGAAVNINGLYGVTTSSNNIRLGAFDLTQSITGVLNADVSTGFSGVTLNFVSQSFGNADEGYIHLEVNGEVIATASLSGTTGLSTRGINPPGSGSGVYLNLSGSGFTNLSITGSAVKEDGTDFTIFQHRTGRYLIHSSSQRNGWNYARVLHYADGNTLTTNYVEWVNDSNSDALAATTNSIVPGLSGTVHLSGIEYYTSGNAVYRVTVSNAYRNVYDKNEITFTTSFCSMSGQPKPTINALLGGEDHTKVLHITASGQITQDIMLTGTLTASVNISHPFKSNLVGAGQADVGGILLYRLSGSSIAEREFFQKENFRIQSSSFNAQSDITAASSVWDSTKHMTASNGGHSNGLQFFSSSLRSPLNTLFEGDFRSANDGGSVTHGPDENPNYSTQTGLRTFYRFFKNRSGETQYTAQVAISGSNTSIVNSSTSLNASRIRCFLKVPSGTAGSTGWLDLARAFSFGSYEDNDGCFDGSFDSSLNASNVANFGIQGIANNESMCMRIEADSTWEGQLDYIEVAFGAGTGNALSAPALSQIDADSTGVTSKLSFGASKAIASYTSVAASAGLGAAVDVNGVYQVATSSNNIRAGTFNGSSAFVGDLNPQVTAESPSYVAKAFDQAITGTLSLEVNGSILHTLFLSATVGTGEPGAGTGISTASNGSGFVSISTFAPSEFSNGVKDYTKLYRTSKYSVSTTDQTNGWNYARVIHAVTGTNRTTSYTEWVNDSDSNALTITNLEMQNFGIGSSEPYYQSGIGYFVNCTSSIRYQSDNAYENVYSDLSSAVTTPTETNLTINNIMITGSGVTDQIDSGDNSTLAALKTGVSNSEELPIFVTHSVAFSQSESLPGPFGSTTHSVTGTVRVKHPLKSNITSAEVAKGVFLVFTSSNTSDLNNNEHFTSEEYRIQSGTYSNQASVILQSNKWSPSSSMNNVSDLGHYAGSLVYNDQMISPLSGVLGGDYRSSADGGSIQAPDNNPNYSSLGISHREYERYFQNNTSSDTGQITITLYGDATLVGRSGANSGSLGINKNMHIDVKIPGKTGYLDLVKPSAGAGNISDGNGSLSGDLDSNVDASGASNICTFNGETLNGTASSPEYVIIRLVSHKQFTGKVSRIQVAYS